MKWTSEPPTEPGWYLFFSNTPTSIEGNFMICHYVFRWHGRLYVGASPKDKNYYDWVVTLHQFHKWHKTAKWAGPILEPEG